MADGGRGASSVLELRNAFLEGLEAVDVDSLAPEELGDGLKFIRAAVDFLELQAAR
jgi:hypothetical protein